jgi:hypothetical protein
MLYHSLKCGSVLRDGYETTLKVSNVKLSHLSELALTWAEKAELPLKLEKALTTTTVTRCSLFQYKPQWYSYRIGTAVWTSEGRACIDADITEIINL